MRKYQDPRFIMLHIFALYTDPVDIPQFGLEASPLRPSIFLRGAWLATIPIFHLLPFTI